MVSVPQQPVLVLMGVSGTGKSTVAAVLVNQLGWDLAEGDDLHPAANVEKMRAGHPLTDEDRWPWLNAVAAWISDHTTAGRPGIVTCSALKRSYRDVLRGDNVVFVHLVARRDELVRRLAARTGHYMPASLLDSQLASLEPPGPDEHAVNIDVTPGSTPESVAAEIISGLGPRPPTDRSGKPGRRR